VLHLPAVQSSMRKKGLVKHQKWLRNVHCCWRGCVGVVVVNKQSSNETGNNPCCSFRQTSDKQREETEPVREGSGQTHLP
jgi:hypothetical protein